MPPTKTKPEHTAVIAKEESTKTDRYTQYKKGENKDLGEEDEVHEYLGPQGIGYIIIERKDGQERHTDYGPEGRSTNWFTPQPDGTP